LPQRCSAWPRPKPSYATPARRHHPTARSAPGTFGQQQPESPASRKTYDQVSKALDDADGIVTDLRIALVNGDRNAVARLVRQLAGTAEGLRQLGDTAK
jgi:hypothetical protein